MGLKKVAAANRNNGKETHKGKSTNKKGDKTVLLERTTFDETNAKVNEQLDGGSQQN